MMLFLGILAALMLVLSIRITLLAEWTNRLDAWVCWLFLRFPLKKKEKSGERAAKHAEKTAGDEQKKKEKKAGEPRALEDTIAMVLDMASSATGPLRMLLRNLRVSLIELHMTVAEEDAAQTAIKCGQMNAYLYGAYATLKSIVKIKRASIDVRPDFLAEEGGFTFKLRVSITPLVVLGAALRFGIEFLWNTAKNAAKPPVAAARDTEEQYSAVGAGSATPTGKPPKP